MQHRPLEDIHNELNQTLDRLVLGLSIGCNSHDLAGVKELFLANEHTEGLCLLDSILNGKELPAASLRLYDRLVVLSDEYAASFRAESRLAFGIPEFLARPFRVVLGWGEKPN
ncbi:hypothetical protein [Hyphobacterium sp.]|uniref:hypothetical protein n=1 Tax=Hyphobacterium sp. TaxID=2004662 RepID=UPI003BAD35F7